LRKAAVDGEEKRPRTCGKNQETNLQGIGAAKRFTIASTGRPAYAADMRIITGSAGGIPIAVPRTVLRPTADRVREAVFSILGARVEEASVLDLFAGSGSYGLECLSRGARRAVFVEADRGSCAVISQNLAKARLTGGTVAGAPVESWLKRAPAERFDLIFADPPYAKQRGDRDWNALLLSSAELSGLLAPGGLFILESFAKGGQPLPPGASWQAVDERRYGDSLLVFYQLPSADAPAPDPAAV
jgi:16S rRNA (guanine966-N2)-methyltransferase